MDCLLGRTKLSLPGASTPESRLRGSSELSQSTPAVLIRRLVIGVSLGLLTFGAAFMAVTRRYVVTDESMKPTLLPGDRLLVLRIGRVRDADVVVLQDPEHASRLLVKRVAGISDGRLVVQGDNAARSRDSRSFGSVSAGLVEGRVVWRYFPADRRGRLPPATARR